MTSFIFGWTISYVATRSWNLACGPIFTFVSYHFNVQTQNSAWMYHDWQGRLGGSCLSRYESSTASFVLLKRVDPIWESWTQKQILSLTAIGVQIAGLIELSKKNITRVMRPIYQPFPPVCVFMCLLYVYVWFYILRLCSVLQLLYIVTFKPIRWPRLRSHCS